MNDLQSFIHTMTIENFKEAIPNYTKEQLVFAEDITEKLILDQDTNKVNAVPAPCGFGKSIIIRCYLKAVIKMSSSWEIFGANRSDYKGDGFVIVTDLSKRFNEYEDDKELEGSFYEMNHLKDNNFTEQLIEQNNFPILLITTQKYFMLEENERDFIFKWKNGLRKTVIFDEKPIFYNITEIDKEFINSIDNEIDYIHETEDKQFLDNELKFLRDYLEQEKSKLNDRSENDIITYWKGTRKNITTDDKRFTKLINEYLSPESKIKVETLKDILKDGAIFVNKKNNNVSDNRRYFFTVDDNKKGFYLGDNKAKFWIFDATSDIDLEYQKDYINMLDVEYVKDFIVDVQNVNIGTSRNALNKKGTKDALYNYISDNFNKETLIITYQKNIKDFKEFNNGYLGGIKGINDYKDCTDMAQIGLNRFSDINYLQKFLYIYDKSYKFIKENVSDSEKILKGLLNMEYGNFTNSQINDVMYSMLLVDTEQNIFRTKLRNYANMDKIRVDLIYNSKTYEKLNKMLAERLGIDEFKIVMPTEFIEHSILSRDNGEESHAQKVVRWFNENKGYGEVRTKELLVNVGISENQFKDSKRDNKRLVDYMDRKRIKRGIYVA